MPFDFSKLRGRIREKFRTQALFADAMGLSECVVSQKLNNRSEWSADEIRKACGLLALAPEDIPAYFFAPDVEKTQQRSME